jgi:hypothetical protein
LGGAVRVFDRLRALELRGELLDAARGVHDALLAGVGGVRIGRHVTEDDMELLTVDLLLAGRLEGRLGQELATGGNVDEADVIECRMAFGFHGEMV